jgi:hypothetical protein
MPLSRLSELPKYSDVQLTQSQCPYDGAELEVEVSSTGLLRLLCTTCDAAWELGANRIERTSAPERARVVRARQSAPHTADHRP